MNIFCFVLDKGYTQQKKKTKKKRIRVTAIWICIVLDKDCMYDQWEFHPSLGHRDVLQNFKKLLLNTNNYIYIMYIV